MKIEKPDWPALYKYNCNCGYKNLDWTKAIQWWHEQIIPINKMLANGVEVYSGKGVFPVEQVWNTHKHNIFHTHTAFLINIQPIKQESAEDVLRDALKDGGLSFKNQDRAKKVLGEKS